MKVYGYDPDDWDPLHWFLEVLEGMRNADDAIILLSHHAEWPPWSVAWLAEALAGFPPPHTMIADLGQFPPSTWRSWDGLSLMLARPTALRMAVPIEQWPAYAAAMDVFPQKLTRNTWVTIPLQSDLLW